MKAYILADMEGITGVTQFEQVVEGSEYERARILMTEDINSAAKACFENGINEIVVCDGHFMMHNILIERLLPNISLISGSMGYRKYLQAEGLDNSQYEFAIFIGFHSMARTPNAIIPHTWSPDLLYLKVNGVEFGESALNAAILGEYKIPLIAVTGDDTLEVEVSKTISEKISVGVVKKTLVNGVALCYNPTETNKIIKGAVNEGIQTGGVIFKVKSPVIIEACFKSSDSIDAIRNIPFVTIIDFHRIEVKDTSYLKALEKFVTVFKLTKTKKPKIFTPNALINTNIEKFI